MKQAFQNKQCDEHSLVGSEIPEGWSNLQWGNIATLEYGKGLKNYSGAIGKYPVYGTNGPIGYCDKCLSNSPGVIIGRKGAYRGVHYSKNPFHVIDTAFYLKPKIGDLDLKFAYYELLTQDINGLDTGSAIPSTTRDSFYGLSVKLPPLSTQRAIAKILSDLDDKIELNHQMNKTLESIAQALFKRWFVEFEFPGYEETKFIDGVPEGWEKVPLTDVVDVLGGGTPSTNEPSYWGNELPFFTPKDASDNCYVIETEKEITLEGLENCNSQKYPRNTVFITARGTVGKVCMAGCDMAMNQSCYAIRGKSEDRQQYYIYLLIKSLANQLTQNAHGTVFETITTETFRTTQVIQPPQDVLDEFITCVQSLYDQILFNIQETRKLAQIRDSILPRLMSGKIRARG